MEKSSSSSESGVSNMEAIFGKPIRAAARKANKAMRTLTFKEKGKGASSGDGDASKSSSRSWGSTKSGRRHLGKGKESSDEPEEDVVFGSRPVRRSPRKACTAEGDNCGYPRQGSLRSPCKRPSTTQAPSGLFKRRKPGRPKGSKNKKPAGSKSDTGTMASMGGK